MHTKASLSLSHFLTFFVRIGYVRIDAGILQKGLVKKLFAQLPMALHKLNELLQQMELRVAKDGA
jgi:hypothetical protein